MATTPKGYPYPVGTDRVRDGDDVIHALADKLDATVPYAMAAGSTAIAVTNAPSGTTTVTFPAGRFTQPPLVVATVVGSSSPNFFAGVNPAPTAAGMTVRCTHVELSNTTATVTVHWIAIQMLPGASPGLTEADDNEEREAP